MEERLDYEIGMTDNQYYGIIKMISAIVRHCSTKEEISEELDNLLREADKPRSEAKNTKD